MKNINDFKFLNEKLLQFRKEKGLSQEELGNKIGVSRQAVSKWESGEITPDLNNLVLLCKVLDKKLDELLEGAEDIFHNNKELNSKLNIIKQLNWKKNIIIIFCISILLIFISIIYKCCIIYNINTVVNKNKNLNNYYYRQTDYRTNNGDLTQLFTTELHYKDGVYKRVFTNKNEVQQIIWANNNTKEGYKINLVDKTYSRIDEEEILFYGNENTIYNLREPSIECDSLIEYIILSFPFSKKIKNKKDYYMIKFKNAADYIEIININKETGLPEKHQNSRDEQIEYIQLEYKFNSVSEEDITNEDLKRYTEITINK